MVFNPEDFLAIDEALHVTPIPFKSFGKPSWTELQARPSDFHYEDHDLGEALREAGIRGTWLSLALFDGKPLERSIYPVLPPEIPAKREYWSVTVPISDIKIMHYHEDLENEPFCLHDEAVTLYRVGTGLSPKARGFRFNGSQKPYMAVVKDSKADQVLQEFIGSEEQLREDVRLVDKLDEREYLHFDQMAKVWKVPHNRGAIRAFPQLYIPNHVPIKPEYNWRGIIRMFRDAEGRYRVPPCDSGEEIKSAESEMETDANQ